MINKIMSFAKRILKDETLKIRYSSRLSLLGIPKGERKKLYKQMNVHVAEMNTVLFHKNIAITSPFWYLHSLQELFVDEVYKFNSKTDKPYILDCGANIGLSAIYFKRVYPASRITAFEPDAQLCNIALKNLSSFGYDDIEIVQKAVWVADESLNFKADGQLGGRLNNNEDTVDSGATFKVEATRLKNYLFEKVDFLKIDIEGAEYDVLKDCANDLKNVENLFVEYHGEASNKEQTLAEILNIISNAGFRYYIKEAWDNLPNPFMRYNYNPLYDLQLNIFAYKPNFTA